VVCPSSPVQRAEGEVQVVVLSVGERGALISMIGISAFLLVVWLLVVEVFIVSSVH
jgi:hypothetical protein